MKSYNKSPVATPQPHTRQVWKPTGDEKPVACALCGRHDAPLIGEENGYSVRRCRCGLVFVSPQPSAADLERFYAQYFPEEAGELWGEIMRRNFDADARHVAARAAPGRALDIGAGHGHFLARLKKAGWSVEGLDLSGDAAAAAKKEYGIEVRREMFRPGLVEAAAYDLVTAWYILEHVKDPLGFLTEAGRALKPGGLLGVRVPNMTFSKLFLVLRGVPGMAALLYAAGIGTDGKSSHFNLLDPPTHLYGYSPSTLKALLEKAGFTQVEVLPAKPVDYGSAVTRAVKNVLFGGTALLYNLSGGAWNPAPAVTVFARKR
jgi:SAM-dependent methyltransferase